MPQPPDDDLLFADDDTPVAAPTPPRGEPWRILVVDDDAEVHDVTRLALRDMTFEERPLHLVSARSAKEARERLVAGPPFAVILLDVVMETEDAGLLLVPFIRETVGDHATRIVLRTGQPGRAPEMRVIREQDISDYKAKTDLTAPRLMSTVIAALRTWKTIRQLMESEAATQAALSEVRRLRDRIEQERDYLRAEVREALHVRDLVGESEAFRGLLQRVHAVAETPSTVLIVGESGVGKEVLARTIHEASPRAQGPMVKVNCAAVPRELFESEFFGHQRGAFTGAHKDRAGRFELADGGTLFLDEVGEIPIELQGKLLRAIQEREVERVGEGRVRRVDVRIVAATNRRLPDEVKAGRFREDLYYRLSVFPLEIPPLRARPADIVPLAKYFLARICHDFGRPLLAIDSAMAARLEAHAWPGNARELQNVMERSVILSPPTGPLALDLTPTAPARAPTPPRSPSAFVTDAEVRDFERTNLLAALERAEWKIAGPTGAAALLGLAPSTLTSRMKAMGVSPPAKGGRS